MGSVVRCALALIASAVSAAALAQPATPSAFIRSADAVYDDGGPAARLRVEAEIEGRCLNTIADLAPVGADDDDPSVYRFELETQDPEICLFAIGEWFTVLQIPLRTRTPISEIVVTTGAVEQRFPVRHRG